MRFELAGNRMRVRRPPSILTSAHETLFGAAPMADVRPVSQYAVAQSQVEISDPRYRPDNVAAFELEYPRIYPIPPKALSTKILELTARLELG